MYYELIILGTLMVGPFHGYLIAKIVQNILGPYGKISAGRLYPLLTKLEEDGLIKVEPVSEQQEHQLQRRSHIPSRRYRITEAGRKRLHALLMDTTSYLGEYQKVFLQKVAYFSFLQPEERLQLIEHYLGYCQSLVSYGTARAEEGPDACRHPAARAPALQGAGLRGHHREPDRGGGGDLGEHVLPLLPDQGRRRIV